MAKADGLSSLGSHRVGHDWSDLVAAAAATYIGARLGVPAVTQGMGWKPGIRRREASLQFHQESCFSHPFLAHLIGWISGLWPSEMITFCLANTLCFTEPENALSRENRDKYIKWSLPQFFHILQGLCFFWFLPAWIALQCLPTEISIDYIYTKYNFYRTHYIKYVWFSSSFYNCYQWKANPIHAALTGIGTLVWMIFNSRRQSFHKTLQMKSYVKASYIKQMKEKLVQCWPGQQKVSRFRYAQKMEHKAGHGPWDSWSLKTTERKDVGFGFGETLVWILKLTRYVSIGEWFNFSRAKLFVCKMETVIPILFALFFFGGTV